MTKQRVEAPIVGPLFKTIHFRGLNLWLRRNFLIELPEAMISPTWFYSRESKFLFERIHSELSAGKDLESKCQKSYHQTAKFDDQA